VDLRYDAVVLAGGAGRRLGGQHKPALRVGGVSMLDRVLAACRGAAETVVVGPTRPTSRPVRWTRELPPGGGPVAAIAAGLAWCRAPLLLVLAADLPFLDSGTLERLVAAARCRDGAVLLDADGRVQPLLAAYQRHALEQALAGLGEPANRSVRRLVAGLELARLSDPGQVAFDCDSWADLMRARSRRGAERERERNGEDRPVLEEWVAAVARQLGIEPHVDVRMLLGVAREAAHNVDRPAAPLTTFLVGYAAALDGGDEAALARAAQKVTALAQDWPRQNSGVDGQPTPRG
jgi:molybdopterin-guanine dinucleotide biosynthesis protein A